jgi:hypothetical protein
VLGDVLGFRTAEVAAILETGEASVKGALQRARAALRARLPAADRERAPQPNSASEREVVGRFADAVQSGDPDAHVAVARPYGLFVLTLEGDAIAAITWFADTGIFRHFGLPLTVPSL